jgi:Ca2+:H+ antiporter
VGLLLASTIAIAVMSEMLVGAVEETAAVFGMNEVFVGVILVALIGNAAEHSSAIMMAGKNKMDTAITIAVGSSIQVALFVAPVLVFLSYFVAPQPMDLRFTTLEVVAVGISVWIMSTIAQDGESHWMEGVQAARRVRHSRARVLLAAHARLIEAGLRSPCALPT